MNENADTDTDEIDSGEATDVDQYREVEMSQYTAVQGDPSAFGYRFAVTRPLIESGITFETLQGDTEALLYLGEPDAEQGVLTGSLVIREGLPTGHKHERYRRIYNNESSLQVYLKSEDIRAMGIDVDEVTPDTDPTEIESPPVLDVWASKEGMAFKQLDIREVVVNKELDRAVEALPKQMAADYRAITQEDYTYSELAEEYAKEMETPVNIIEWKIRRNVEEAENRIEEYNATHQD